MRHGTPIFLLPNMLLGQKGYWVRVDECERSLWTTSQPARDLSSLVHAPADSYSNGEKKVQTMTQDQLQEPSASHLQQEPSS